MKEFNSIIYLLYIDTPDGRLYKIGHTKRSITERIIQLQTGCPYEIKILKSYNSIYGQVVERTLHNLFSHLKTHGEWFNMGIYIEVEFIKLCEKYENINDSLKNNII